MDKRAWRRELRARRAAIPPEEREARGMQMVEHFFRLPRVAGGPTTDGETSRRALLYVAVPPEAPTQPLAERLLQAGWTVCLPRLDRTRPGRMDIVPVAGWHELVPGPYFDIPQPAAAAEAVMPDTMDVIVVPAVGFDRAGRRIGQGGGYYDRLLANVPRRIARVGWAFSVQVVDELPEEAHDERVDVIVTEAGIVRPTPAPTPAPTPGRTSGWDEREPGRNNGSADGPYYWMG